MLKRYKDLETALNEFRYIEEVSRLSCNYDLTSVISIGSLHNDNSKEYKSMHIPLPEKFDLKQHITSLYTEKRVALEEAIARLV